MLRGTIVVNMVYAIMSKILVYTYVYFDSKLNTLIGYNATDNFFSI